MVLSRFTMQALEIDLQSAFGLGHAQIDRLQGRGISSTGELPKDPGSLCLDAIPHYSSQVRIHQRLLLAFVGICSAVGKRSGSATADQRGRPLARGRCGKHCESCAMTSQRCHGDLHTRELVWAI